MILNYRVELCRQCYFKRTHQCSFTDDYIHNSSLPFVKPSGECVKFKAVPWIPQL
ncbi:hypothetical protein Desor_3402 [Desulfosporosinus orientis DSM 765]|uniref:Uncharacterized protein n=1 Tax=Desulfosporosinus orientis (strain ATCC 19365 / DSM 765 / NCIMB 8382 / VKM B-1628 / Singapore I) TaxID=768706 RepID=G7WFM4_DESOD|nr:hypothetical protein [Desulfosporosinus orientis]AET68897.1 hypothetical protein Desor_3402 [Desulfosporosinus orientis DSM 765]